MAYLILQSLALWSVCASAGKTPPLDSQTAVNYLNELFARPSSSATTGVIMRQMKDWELFCGGACYKGRPDCTVSAEFFNQDVGMFKSKFVGEFMFAPYAGVVFNTDMVETDLARCYYQVDGKSWGRYNGGCGCSADKASVEDCASPHSPYHNIGPDGHFVDGDSPWATRCMCNSTGPNPNQPCFWRGAAYNTSHGPFGGSELAKMVEQYKNEDKRTVVQWDEVVLDGRRLQDILSKDPASAIVAVYYDNPSFHGGKTSEYLKIAQVVQATLRRKYGVEFPIVSVNQTAVLTRNMGPFRVHHDAAAATSDDAPTSVSVVV